MGRLHLIVGPVGAGKSTLAGELCRRHDAVRLVLDEWMTRLYGADPRPAEGRVAWYQERVGRCLEQIWEVAHRTAELGTDVVLEIGLIRRDERSAFYERVDAAGLPLTVYLVDAPRDVRRARVERRNRERGETFSMEVPMPFFELASDLWQPPDEAERRERDIREVGVSTRRATEADLDLLVALNGWVHDLHVVNDPAVYRPTVSEEVAGWFRDVLASDNKEVWLAETLGYVVLELQARPGSPFSHPVRQLRIDQIAVHGEARRRGVGRALMALASERARELGCARIVLDVAAFNTEALAFYEALGFEPGFHRLTGSRRP